VDRHWYRYIQQHLEEYSLSSAWRNVRKVMQKVNPHMLALMLHFSLYR